MNTYIEPSAEELALAEERKRKADEVRATIQAERQKIYDQREARIRAEATAEIERVRTEDPARRLATLLRAKLDSGEAQDFIRVLGKMDFKEFRDAFAMILSDEAAQTRNADMLDARQVAMAGKPGEMALIERMKRDRELGIA